MGRIHKRKINSNKAKDKEAMKARKKARKAANKAYALKASPILPN